MPANPQPAAARRIIGPIPPRDHKGRLRIDPIKAKRLKVNALHEPIRDKDGQPIEEEYDQREHRDYLIFEPGMVPSDGATRGLKLFQVDLPGEPLVQVYARGSAEAVEVWKAEMGIRRLGGEDPKVTEVSAP